LSTYFFTHFATHLFGSLGVGLSNFPWLSASILFPIGSAFVIPFFPDKGDGKEVRWFALSIALITFLITVGSYINGFDISNENVQLKENISWLPDLGLTWSVGADGMSMPLILLTSFITALAVLAAWPVKFKPKLFFFLILVMDGGQIAVFAVQDMLLFFLTWELELITVYLLLAIWGGKNRQYAATKFIIYTAGSSIFILLAALAMGFYGTEIPNFEFSHLAAQDFSQKFQILCYVGLLIAFGVKLPIVPLHTWLPDAHGEATAPVHMLLAGILLKMGGYALLRFNAQLLPVAHAQFAPLLIVLGVVNIIYAALTSFAQRNLKRKIAYSSISHMGFVLIGIGSFSSLGTSGAMLQMVSHGLIGASLFFLEFDNSEKPIYFYINSTGTSWYTGDAIGFETEAFAICDTLRYVKPPVHTICIGQAMGTAAVILSAGTKGQRAALPHASIVLHQPRSGAQGQATDIQIRAKEVIHNKKAMLEILSHNTGRSVDQLSKDSDRMSYLNPHEAVDYGIIDRVLTSRKDLPSEKVLPK